jgi:hypothetical protein
LHGFYDFNYVYKLPYTHLSRLLKKAREKREKQKAWDMWLTKYQHMDEKTFLPFSEFYRKLTQPISTRATEDILNEVEEIRRLSRKEGE